MTDTAAHEEILREYQKIARLGSRRSGYLLNTSLASLCWLARSAESDKMRLEACRVLLQTGAVQERLGALTRAAGRRSSSKAVTDQLEEQLTALLSVPGNEDNVRAAFKEALMPHDGKPQ